MPVRYDLMPIVEEDTDGSEIDLYDLLSVSWEDFPFGVDFLIRALDQTEVTKTWFLAYRYFANVEFEDLLMLINDVENPLDMQISQKMKIPAELSINQFMISTKQDNGI